MLLQKFKILCSQKLLDHSYSPDKNKQCFKDHRNENTSKKISAKAFNHGLLLHTWQHLACLQNSTLLREQKGFDKSSRFQNQRLADAEVLCPKNTIRDELLVRYLIPADNVEEASLWLVSDTSKMSPHAYQPHVIHVSVGYKNQGTH